MSFNISSINVYKDEITQPLIYKMVMGDQSLAMVGLVTGVKPGSTQTLNYFEPTISVQNSTCGFTSNGSTTFTQRSITNVALEHKDNLCYKDLLPYFMAQKFSSGSPKDEDLGMILAEAYVKKIQENIAYTFWQGNDSSTGNTYPKADGILTWLAGADSATTVRVTGTTFTSATIEAIVDSYIAAIPEEIADRTDLYLFVPYTFYKMYLGAMRTKYNIYQTQVSENGQLIFEIPGTMVKMVSCHGLKGTNNIVLTYGENLVRVTDLEHEEEKFFMKYDEFTDQVYLNIQWSIGTQIKFPAFVVTNV